MVFDCLRSSSWTRNSFPGGTSYSQPMLFAPVLTSPYMGAATLPAMTPMMVPMQMSAHVQTIPVPVAVQQPSPVVQVLSQPVVQATPSPVVATLPQTYTAHQTPRPASHVPSPVIQSSIPVVPQSQGSPGRYTVNLYVNTPEHRSRQLDDGSPSPTIPPQLWEQQQQWQQQQEQQQRLWQHEQQQQQQRWQDRQSQQQQQWRQQQQLQQRGRPQSARPLTPQPLTPSSVNINLFGPQPRLAQPGSIYIQTPTPPLVS